MRIYWCERCLACCPRRKSKITKNNITTLSDIITHKDGTKERIEWASFEADTQRVIEFKLV